MGLDLFYFFFVRDCTLYFVLRTRVAPRIMVWKSKYYWRHVLCVLRITFIIISTFGSILFHLLLVAKIPALILTAGRVAAAGDENCLYNIQLLYVVVPFLPMLYVPSSYKSAHHNFQSASAGVSCQLRG